MKSTLFILLALVACGDPMNRDRDGDGFIGSVDCDDDDPMVFPGRTEVPFDGVDNDCNPETLDDDQDEDGFGAEEDCDDEDPAVRPNLPEIAYDGIDNDCDPETPDDDIDRDGFPNATDCNDNSADIFPGQDEIYYDGVDNDCDINTVDNDQDGDGVSVAVDCDDLDGNRRGPTLWFVDCDLDGFSADATDAVESCELPPTPTSCGEDGTYTNIAPIGGPFDAGNTTVDCLDVNPDIHPDRLAFAITIEDTLLPPESRYDVNCDGEEEPEFGLYACSVSTAPDGTSVCNWQDGFVDDVPCGVVGNYASGCTIDPADDTCGPMGEPDARVRACR